MHWELSCPYTVHNRVETGSAHPGQPDHVSSGSNESDPVNKISGSDPDSA